MHVVQLCWRRTALTCIRAVLQYVGEAVAAIAESAIKTKDIPAAVQVRVSCTCRPAGLHAALQWQLSAIPHRRFCSMVSQCLCHCYIRDLRFLWGLS